MSLLKPGTPYAKSISIDSVTLVWKPAADFMEASYKVLYRPTEDTTGKYTVINSHYIPVQHIKDLIHGAEYEFKVQATYSDSGDKVESSPCRIKTKEYYDIVLIGKTGQGKSTLGNKLLNLDNTDTSNIRLFGLPVEIDSSTPATGKKKRFVQANDPDNKKQSGLSVTAKCELMANEVSNIRILDVPGFSDSGALSKEAGRKLNVYNGNLQIVRYLVREQVQSQLKVRRIVYFLPLRGYPEKADGTMQEELQILHHFFGKEIFKSIMIAATNAPTKKHQNLGFDDEDRESIEKVFKLALKTSFPDDDIDCPPIVYLGFNDTPKEALDKIKTAPIVQENIVPLKFKDDACARCSVKIRQLSNDDKKLVVYPDGTIINYEESKCHPCFIQKYSTAQKFFGGLGHVATLGLALLSENSWCGFTNSDEMCISCKMSPGAEGCKVVGTKIFNKRDKKDVPVKHSSKMYEEEEKETEM